MAIKNHIYQPRETGHNSREACHVHQSPGGVLVLVVYWQSTIREHGVKRINRISEVDAVHTLDFLPMLSACDDFVVTKCL